MIVTLKRQSHLVRGTEKAEILTELALAYYEVAQYRDASLASRQSASLFLAAGNRESYLWNLYNAAEFLKEGGWSDSLPIFRSVLSNLPPPGEGGPALSLLRARTLHGLGDAMRDHFPEPPESILTLYEAGHVILEDLVVQLEDDENADLLSNSLEQLARLRQCMGSHLSDLMQTERALQVIRAARKHWEEKPTLEREDLGRLGQSWSDEAKVYLRLNEMTRAFGLFETAASVYSKGRGTYFQMRMAMCRHNQARIAISNNQYDQAAQLLHEARSISLRLRDDVSLAEIDEDIGSLHVSRSDPVLAEAWHISAWYLWLAVLKRSGPDAVPHQVRASRSLSRLSLVLDRQQRIRQLAIAIDEGLSYYNRVGRTELRLKLRNSAEPATLSRASGERPANEDRHSSGPWRWYLTHVGDTLWSVLCPSGEEAYGPSVEQLDFSSSAPLRMAFERWALAIPSPNADLGEVQESLRGPLGQDRKAHLLEYADLGRLVPGALRTELYRRMLLSPTGITDDPLRLVISPTGPLLGRMAWSALPVDYEAERSGDLPRLIDGAAVALGLHGTSAFGIPAPCGSNVLVLDTLGAVRDRFATKPESKNAFFRAISSTQGEGALWITAHLLPPSNDDPDSEGIWLGPQEAVLVSDLVAQGRRLKFPSRVFLAGCSTVGFNNRAPLFWRGLAPAFLYAGTKLVIGSVWPVAHDRSSATLDGQIVEQVLLHPDPIVALRDLQAGMLSNWRAGSDDWPPYRWASHVVVI